MKSGDLSPVTATITPCLTHLLSPLFCSQVCSSVCSSASLLGFALVAPPAPLLRPILLRSMHYLQRVKSDLKSPRVRMNPQQRLLPNLKICAPLSSGCAHKHKRHLKNGFNPRPNLREPLTRCARLLHRSLMRLAKSQERYRVRRHVENLAKHSSNSCSSKLVCAKVTNTMHSARLPMLIHQGFQMSR